MNGFDQQVLARLPLAEAVLSVLSDVCEEKFLGKIFEEHRGRCYEKSLKFSTFVGLIGDALLKHEGSGSKAFRCAREQDAMPVSDQAAFGKLRRLPLAVSEAFLSQTSLRLQQLFPDEIDSPLPDCFSNWQVLGVDGKKLKRLMKRLKPARGVTGKLLGGKALVARDLHRGVSVAMQAHPDGESNDGPLVPGLLKQVVDLHPEEECLWVMDSQFCDLTTPNQIRGQGHHFLTRHHPKAHFHKQPECEVREGVDRRNRPYRDEIGCLGSPKNKKHLVVRRITVAREGKDDLVLVTSLTDMDAFPAADLLDAYADRWTIETMFQHVTEVFCLQKLIGATAQASVFQASFCLLLYNIIHLLRVHISAEQCLEVEQISIKKVFDDVKDQLTALRVLVSTAEIVEQFPGGQSSKQVRRRLKALLRRAWKPHWLKAPKNKRNPKPPPRKITGGHTSIYRLQAAEKT